MGNTWVQIIFTCSGSMYLDIQQATWYFCCTSCHRNMPCLLLCLLRKLYVYFWGLAMDSYIPASDKCKGKWRWGLLHPLSNTESSEVLSYGERASQLLTNSASEWCSQKLPLFFHAKSWKDSKAPNFVHSWCSHIPNKTHLL